ncbi:MAG: RNA-directed DNA polymerase [Clostridiales bacterium]|nr:RNA-directed DNA polymerase [Clostridiales bacterium]
MKKEIKELTNRSNVWSNETRILKLKQYIRGWINYFKLADMKKLLQRSDEWMRHRIRAIYWKQWKKVKTKIRKLRSLNLPEWAVLELANSRKGIWRSSLVLNYTLTKQAISNLGYMYMTDYYLKVCEN